jgi:hypothetical protein
MVASPMMVAPLIQVEKYVKNVKKNPNEVLATVYS